MDEIQKYVSDSKIENHHLLHPEHLNAVGTLYGGKLMEWVDEVATVTAKKHAGGNVTTACVDHFSFIKPAAMPDRVVVSGVVTYVGNSSMEVRVDAFTEGFDNTRELISRAYLTMIGLGEDGRPTRLPRLIPVTDEEKAEWERAEKRKTVSRELYS